MIKKHLTKSRVIWFSAFLTAVILNTSYLLFPKFADLMNGSISAFFRSVLAGITNIFPFSVGEILIYLSLPFAVLTAVLAIRKNKTLKSKLIFVFSVTGKLITVICLLFAVTFAPGYHRPGLDTKLGFERKNVSASELYDTLIYVIEKTNEYAGTTGYSDSGASFMPFTLGQLSDKLSTVYGEVYADHGISGNFYSKVKPLIISPYMTYTHISGVYSFFTGEANLNTNYPDFINVFSTAHEFAHQRGIAKEDEANFMAYLICISSDDNYIRYSGYLNMYSYLADALYSADRDLYSDAVSRLSDSAKKELYAYSKFFDKYRNDTVSVVSDTVNDAYLKSQGTEGSASYGMVVDLAVAYHKDRR